MVTSRCFVFGCLGGRSGWNRDSRIVIYAFDFELGSVVSNRCSIRRVNGLKRVGRREKLENALFWRFLEMEYIDELSICC